MGLFSGGFGTYFQICLGLVLDGEEDWFGGGFPTRIWGCFEVIFSSFSMAFYGVSRRFLHGIYGGWRVVVGGSLAWIFKACS